MKKTLTNLKYYYFFSVVEFLLTIKVNTFSSCKDIKSITLKRTLADFFLQNFLGVSGVSSIIISLRYFKKKFSATKKLVKAEVVRFDERRPSQWKLMLVSIYVNPRRSLARSHVGTWHIIRNIWVIVTLDRDQCQTDEEREMPAIYH